MYSILPQNLRGLSLFLLDFFLFHSLPFSWLVSFEATYFLHEGHPTLYFYQILQKKVLRLTENSSFPFSRLVSFEVTYSLFEGGCGQIGPTVEMITRPPPLFKEKVRKNVPFFTWKEQKICEGTKEAQGMLWWLITKEGKGTLAQDAMQQVIISMWNIF